MVNNKKLPPLECILLVENYFEIYFQNYKQLKKNNYTGYWSIEYINDVDGTKIYFDGDIGGHFSIKIVIGGTEYSLWQFDRSVNQATLSTNSNIIYQLEVLKNFLSQTN